MGNHCSQEQEVEEEAENGCEVGLYVMVPWEEGG